MKWNQAFEHELTEKARAGELINILDTQKTSHAHTAKSADKMKALHLLRKKVKDTRLLYELGLSFTRMSNFTANELGVMILSDLFELNPQEVISEVYRTADSENWEVREWAASAGGNILSRHFQTAYPILSNWVGDPLPNIRRAAALAVMYAAKELPERYSEQLISLVEQLLTDRDIYVRKNLGPFAIGGALLRYYPEKLKERILSWHLSDNEQVLWNVAMIFTSAEGAKDKNFALKILKNLACDDRRYVQNAVKAAVKNLAKRHKEDFSAMIMV
ncbi:hypothetical protein PA598K_04530 [Paenibacillus sp. 598K]|uniref:DNA alkylation repair protein n=1 Tax=Paenibacillus sp. 598K TaxID=1117987 RepID=UPI000FFA9096|nr:HEAT repeat domain-containing protein [Paenibacillus sp. 598K]GBF76087.1 hypothetical protein PA598K_04530 [Paenibacillus sp. 598K]